MSYGRKGGLHLRGREGFILPLAAFLELFIPVTVHGVVIGNQVKIQGSSTYTDDHSTDSNYLKYYALMPGFTYPPELKTAVTVSGGWREIREMRADLQRGMETGFADLRLGI